MINTTRNTRRNLDNNNGAATSQQPENESSAGIQLASTTGPEITSQEESSQDDDAVPSSPSDKNIDYKKLLAEKQAKKHRLQTKRDFRIAQAKNKYLEEFFRQNEVRASSSRRFRENNFNSENDESTLKKRRSAQSIRSVNLDLYYEKNFKK